MRFSVRLPSTACCLGVSTSSRLWMTVYTYLASHPDCQDPHLLQDLILTQAHLVLSVVVCSDINGSPDDMRASSAAELRFSQVDLPDAYSFETVHLVDYGVRSAPRLTPTSPPHHLCCGSLFWVASRSPHTDDMNARVFRSCSRTPTSETCVHL